MKINKEKMKKKNMYVNSDMFPDSDSYVETHVQEKVTYFMSLVRILSLSLFTL